MSEALSVDDFAAQLAQADQPEQPQEEDSGPVEPVEQESEGQPEGQEAEPEAQAEEEGEEGQGEQPEEPDSTEDRVIKWTTASGEVFEVPEKELQAGYMRDSDYRQKTQAVAEERKQVQQLAQQRVQEVERYAEDIGRIQTMQAELQQYRGVNWQQLQVEDPQQYQMHKLREMELHNNLRDAGQALMLKRQQFAEQATQQTVEEQEKAVAASEQHLVKVFPNITRADTETMFKTLFEKGATADDINVLKTRPWAVELAMYATKWLALQEQKPKAVKKVAAVPQKAPAAQRTAPSKSEQLVKTVLSKKTLSVNDFAAALAQTSKR